MSRPKREVPDRGEKIKIQLPFDEALRAAMQVAPEKEPKRRPGRPKKATPKKA